MTGSSCGLRRSKVPVTVCSVPKQIHLPVQTNAGGSRIREADTGVIRYDYLPTDQAWKFPERIVYNSSEFEEIHKSAEKTAFRFFPEPLFRELPLPVFVFFHDFLAHGFGIFAVGVDIVEGFGKEFNRCSSAVP